jgi:hypothetical protein
MIIKLAINEFIRILVFLFISQLYLIFSKNLILNNKIGLNSTLLTSLDFLTSNTQNNMLIIQIDHNTSRVVYENNFFDNKIFIEGNKQINNSNSHDFSIPEKLLIKSNNNLNNFATSFQINNNKNDESNSDANQDNKKTMAIFTLLENNSSPNNQVASNKPLNKCMFYIT